MTILPKKLSALIQLALVDLEAVEKQPDIYTVDMGYVYHRMPIEAKAKCSVCFAGAVMAKTLNAEIDAMYLPHDFSGNTFQLRALDEMRSYRILEALQLLDENLTAKEKIPFLTCSGPTYEDSPSEFKNRMTKIALDLAAAGL